MITLAYYDKDPVGNNTVEWLESHEDGMSHGMFRIVKLDEAPIYSNSSKLDGAELVMFISKHSSAKGVASFTVHSCGNWGDSADRGGKPKTLCRSDPIAMWKLLVAIRDVNTYDEVAVTYEATHHGPTIDLPCLFVEVGGNETTIGNRSYAEVLAKAIRKSIIDADVRKPRIAIGIGGLHYPVKFTKMALENETAFSYIMSRYNVNNTDMLQKAINMSTVKPDFAAIEWKSLRAEERKAVIDALEAIGLEYERI